MMDIMPASVEVSVHSAWVNTTKLDYTVEMPAKIKAEAWLILVHGWLSNESVMAGARHMIAQERGQRVVTFTHPRSGNFAGNIGQQHVANCVAIVKDINKKEEKQQTFHLLGHSHGGVDAAFTAGKLQKHGQAGIEAVGYDASVGLNGKTINPVDLILAWPSIYAESLRAFRHNPVHSLLVGRDVLLGLWRNPALAMSEGWHAGSTDIRSNVAHLATKGVVQAEFYYENDLLVRPPKRDDVTIYPDLGHLGPFVEPAVAVASADKLEELSSV